MSVEAALEFIERLREGQSGVQIDAHGDDLQAVVEVGSQMGYHFAADEVRAAFRYDWQRRWQRFNPAQP